MTTPALSDDFASARRPLLTVVPDWPEPESSVWVEVDGETVCAFGFIALALVALAKFLLGFDGDWTRLGWYLLAAVAAPPLIMIAIGIYRARSASILSRTQVVHVHGTDWDDAARHEAGHAGVAQKVGGRVTEGVIRKDGTGYVIVHHSRSATAADYVAVSLAGGYREGVDPWRATQCRGDRKNIAAVMGGVPWSERAAVRAQAVRIGRGSGIRSFYAASVEARLKRTGRL